MPRYKLTIEYDGTPFVGWQVQAGGLSVQGLIETAIEALTGEKTAIQGAGRTDAGVHALGQVAHAELSKDWEPDTVRDALNAYLRPHPIAVLAAEKAAPTISTRVSPPSGGIISIASSTGAPISRSSASAPGAWRARWTSAPCMQPRSFWSASTTSPPSARPNARRNRR